MARPKCSKVKDVKQRLLTRLREGFYRPGDRFLSNRAICSHFGISYQTSDRLVRELCAEGLLERRPGSGTYVPGAKTNLEGVELIFHPRAKKAGSFGARLLQLLTARLERDRISYKISWCATGRQKISLSSFFPVIWECRAALDACVAQKNAALLLNDQPPSGLASAFIDSVATDDFSGGACAAQLLKQRARSRGKFVILSGPADDARSNRRVAGFHSIAKAEVISADGWYFEDGHKRAAAVMSLKPRGVFCCNDRLAEALLAYCAKKKIPAPRIVGFDDAPIAEQLNLTTIAIPWGELVGGAMAVIKKRLDGDTGATSNQIFIPRPVLRHK